MIPSDSPVTEPDKLEVIPPNEPALRIAENASRALVALAERPHPDSTASRAILVLSEAIARCLLSLGEPIALGAPEKTKKSCFCNRIGCTRIGICASCGECPDEHCRCYLKREEGKDG